MGDRGGEEQGVEGRAVEAFAGVGPGGDCEERPSAGLRLQAAQCLGAGLGAHPAAENDRSTVMPPGRDRSVSPWYWYEVGWMSGQG
jgi:hypothetical protein